MKNTPTNLREAIIVDALKIGRSKDFLALPKDAEHRMCSYWALAVILACYQHGLKPVFQCGSAVWNLLDVPAQHAEARWFGYTFDPDTMPLCAALGIAPQHHAWVALPASNEIIDITMGFLKTQVKEHEMIHGPLPEPVGFPNYLWFEAGTGDNGVHYPRWSYKAHEIATVAFVRFLMKEYPHFHRWLLRAKRQRLPV